jgi:hypothetical protein
VQAQHQGVLLVIGRKQTRDRGDSELLQDHRYVAELPLDRLLGPADLRRASRLYRSALLSSSPARSCASIRNSSRPRPLSGRPSNRSLWLVVSRPRRPLIASLLAQRAYQAGDDPQNSRSNKSFTSVTYKIESFSKRKNTKSSRS